MLSAQVVAPLDAGTGLVVIHLDPSEPFLCDHRVGGVTLLSTVMGIEAMGAAALQLRPESRVCSVSGLVNHPDLFVPDSRPLDVEVHVERAGSGLLGCRVFSRSGVALQLHYEATVGIVPTRGLTGSPRPASRAEVEHRVASSGPEPAGSIPSPTALDARGAGAMEIYRLLFHGPAFRVVQRASVSGGTATAWLSPQLPPLTRAGGPSAVAPRVVELCLQASGLCELAATGRMTIPRGIDRIDRHTEFDTDAGLSLRAVTRRREAGAADRSGAHTGLTGEPVGSVFDAWVLDKHDRVHLEVTGYRTTAYGHQVDEAEVEAVVSALRR